MFRTDDTILYGAQGICKIVEISRMDLTGDMVEYYVLRPIYHQTCTIYVPVDNNILTSKMRNIMSAEEVYALIKTMHKEDSIWIEDERERWGKYVEILSSGAREEIIRLIKTLHQHKVNQKAKGKRLHVTDEHILSDAEKILHEEFAHILNIRPDKVVSFILEQIENN